MANVEPDSTPEASQQKTQNNALGFFSSFLYKSIFFALLVFFLPLFPSQAPEFVNQTILTRSWELIHLLLVGIAVSYGLFSRRNADPLAEKDMLQKSEVSQAYVSIFDDEEVEMSPTMDGNKTHMRNSRYYRGESTVVVAPENSGNRGDVGKPLSLPVRSLKSEVSDREQIDAERMLSGLRLASKSGENGGPDLHKRVASEEESVVLPSPIPWRSRSERMEVKTETSGVTNSPSNSVPSSPSVVRAQSFQSRRTRRASPSPSPSHSVSPSPELRAKNVDELVKKRSFYKSSPPPPPPPPPPDYFHVHRSQHISDNNSHVRRSFKDELKDMSRSGERTEPIASVKPYSTEQRIPEQNYRPPVAPAPKKTVEKKNGSSRKFIIDSSDDDVSDKDHGSESSNEAEYESSNSAVEPETDANEVDKKADEFIAKFREQIRLQRIDSIKRSTVQKRGSRTRKE